MNKKVESWIRKKTWKSLMMVKRITARMGVNIYSNELLTKIHEGYMKFLNIAYNIISAVTVSGTFLWFMPIFLKLGWERTGVIVLVVILLKLQFSKINVKVE